MSLSQAQYLGCPSEFKMYRSLCLLPNIHTRKDIWKLAGTVEKAQQSFVRSLWPSQPGSGPWNQDNRMWLLSSPSFFRQWCICHLLNSRIYFFKKLSSMASFPFFFFKTQCINVSYGDILWTYYLLNYFVELPKNICLF